MRLRNVSGLVVSSLFLSGCLTVARGTTEAVEIISKPEGAQVHAELLSLDGTPETRKKNTGGKLDCTSTPCTVNIPRSNHARIEVGKTGYQSIKFLVVSKGSSPTSTIKPGMIVAGQPPGSYVVAGKSRAGTRILSGNTMTAMQATTVLVGNPGFIVDKMTGANRSMSPNPVTVILAPVEKRTGKTEIKSGEKK